MQGSDALTVRRLGAEEANRAPRSDQPDRSGHKARPEAPVVLGRYRLRRRLGTGGFATVWLAHDERLEREVAVKILPRERVRGGRFEREARAAARLAHPGIVTLYEAAVDDEGAYLVSELVHGATLDVLLEEGRLSDRDVIQIGIALCDALAHAHGRGVIHRDVKPSNVLVPDRSTTPAQLARLTDFGVARMLGGDSLTRTGDVIGTAAYMAPEQAQGLPAGASADLFSLALVLYEALSGTNPLRSGTAARRAGMHLPPLRRHRRDLPRELGGAIDLALRPRPGERGSVTELRAALVASVGRVEDEPGVVADPWPARTRPTRTRDDEEGSVAFDPLDHLDEVDRPDHRTAAERRDRPARAHATPVGWPRRALAGVAAAAITAWLAHRLPGASPAPGAAALDACICGLLVAGLPRAGWLVVTAVLAGSLAIHGETGTALVLAVAALVPIALSPRDGPAWPLAAGGPALSALGLATAWPALAGLSGRSHRRAALAATGWLWAALWTAGIAAYASPHDAIHDVLAPLATVGTLVSCGVWAAAALVLPWTRSRQWPALECMRLALWAIALGLGTAAAGHLGGPTPAGSPGTALAGAFAGALVIFVTRRSMLRLRHSQPAKEIPPTS
jgi:eukaryotic-like serine/threonine-protein kinase